MSQTPEDDAKVRAIADDMSGESPSHYALGYISATIDDEGVSDARFREDVRTVLAALKLARGGA